MGTISVEADLCITTSAPREHAAVMLRITFERGREVSLVLARTSDGNDHQRINSPPIMVTKTVPVGV